MQFQRTIGIDYSGAGKPNDSRPNIRVYVTKNGGVACEKRPNYPSNPLKLHWTRPKLAEWLIEELAKSIPTIVGIDHAFSFPEAYFKEHNISRNWNKFLDDFHRHWPTDEHPINCLRTGDNSLAKKASARCGKICWFRETEEWCKKQGQIPSSVFLFYSQKQVGPSTHTGLSYLWKMRKCKALSNLHFWPFDGWEVETGKSCLVEAYPSLYKNSYLKDENYPREKSRILQDRRDAHAVASWLRDKDKKGQLQSYLDLRKTLPKEALERAKYEGWIIGTPKIEE